MLSYLSSISISVLRSLDTEANKFYDRTNRSYDAALLTRCYTKRALRPVIDSKINHIRHFIKIPFINKGMVSCTTTKLSKLLTSCLTTIKNHVIKYCEKVYERSGKNLFWSIKNSCEVLNKLKS